MTDKERAEFWEKQFKWLEKQHNELIQQVHQLEEENEVLRWEIENL